MNRSLKAIICAVLMILAASATEETTPATAATVDSTIVTAPKPFEVPTNMDECGYCSDLKDILYYVRQGYQGAFQGLYGAGASVVEQPGDKCFGEWFPLKVHQIERYLEQIGEAFDDAGSFSGWRKAAYRATDLVRKIMQTATDLLFDVEKHCHIRDTGEGIAEYCEKAGHCQFDKVAHNLNANMLDLAAKVSRVGSLFLEQKWDERDQAGRGYAVRHIATVASSVFTDLWGFKPEEDRRARVEYQYHKTALCPRGRTIYRKGCPAPASAGEFCPADACWNGETRNPHNCLCPCTDTCGTDEV